MSEEEIEAIEQLRSWRDYIIKNKDKVNKANDIEFYLRTVLNLIEKQQKEIEKYKMLLAESTANRVMTSLKDSKKSKEDLEMLNEGWKIELEQKDKIIDKLAFSLADYVMYYEYDKCRDPEMIKTKAKEQIEYFKKEVEKK